MQKRRLILWSLIVAIFAAFAIWLEPTRVVWGWLHGEAFYQGRPTSWWRTELGQWNVVYLDETGKRSLNQNRAHPLSLSDGPFIFEHKPSTSWLPQWLPWLRNKQDFSFDAASGGSQILRGDPASNEVLHELSKSHESGVHRQAEFGLSMIEWKRSAPRRSSFHSVSTQ